MNGFWVANPTADLDACPGVFGDILNGMKIFRVLFECTVQINDMDPLCAFCFPFFCGGNRVRGKDGFFVFSSLL
jgi:hypothetical protein